MVLIHSQMFYLLPSVESTGLNLKDITENLYNTEVFTMYFPCAGKYIPVLAAASAGIPCPIWGVILPITQLSRDPSKQSENLKLF